MKAPPIFETLGSPFELVRDQQDSQQTDNNETESDDHTRILSRIDARTGVD